MAKQLKFLIPVLVLAALLISAIGFTLSQSNAVSAAASSGNYQNAGSTLYCNPDDCPANTDGICPGGGPRGNGAYGNCLGARSASCPCGGLAAK